jgi:hypothetical protein
MTRYSVRCWIALLIGVHSYVQVARGDCIPSNPTFNEEIAGEGRTIPLPGSCCMADVCGLECPQTVPPPPPGRLDTVIPDDYVLLSVRLLTLLLRSVGRFQGMGSQLPFSSASRPCWAL